MTYWKINYHFVWGTKHREAVLFGENAVAAMNAICAEANEIRSLIYAIAVQPEHVHIALSVPPVYSPSQIAKRLKGKSSHLLTRIWNSGGGMDWSGWQSEYGIITFGEESRPAIVQYINNQEEHHRSKNLCPSFEDLGGPPLRPTNLGEVS